MYAWGKENSVYILPCVLSESIGLVPYPLVQGCREMCKNQKPHKLLLLLLKVKGKVVPVLI
jgi:hypothetical protein